MACRRTINPFFFVMLIAVYTMTACSLPKGSTPVFQSNINAIPTPTSSLIDQFIWQTDGLYGYRMLRPLKWTSVDTKGNRLYLPPNMTGQKDRLTLEAINLLILAEQTETTNGLNATFYLYQQDPTLEGWTKGLEQSWSNFGMKFTLESTLSNAKVYLLQDPKATDEINIAAYILEYGVPLVVGLQASGIYADIEYLRKEGIMDDLEVMVESMQPIQQDPNDIDPPLN